MGGISKRNKKLVDDAIKRLIHTATAAPPSDASLDAPVPMPSIECPHCHITRPTAAEYSQHIRRVHPNTFLADDPDANE